MNNHSPGNVDCWFVTEDDVRNAGNGIPFNPVEFIYAYFRLVKRLDESTLEGWIGRIDKMEENFHSNIDTTYVYFSDYRANKKIYVTLDKTVFYEIDEIFPSKPLLFLLKKINLKSESKPTMSMSITTTVHRLQFHLLGGDIFEHLVFAFLQQTDSWKTIEWLGETGQDRGRDIWAEKDNGTYCFQCANYQQLTSQKVTGDIDKLVRHQTIPDYLTIVCGGRITSALKQKSIAYGTAKGIKNISVWSSSELEEKIRKYTPGLLQRFFEGNPFPQAETIAVSELDELQDAIPTLKISISPNLQFAANNEELGICIAEAFYLLEKGNYPAVKVDITEESHLLEKLRQAKASNTVRARNESLALRKILDFLANLKNEIPEKIRLMFFADLYPVKSDFTMLATSLRQILKLSFNGMRLYEEMELLGILELTEDKTRALKYDGRRKIDCMQSFDGKLGFSIHLTEDEYNQLKNQMPASIDPRNMLVYGLECSDLSQKVLTEKVIPAFIDKVYDMKKAGVITSDDYRSWTYLPSYRLGMG